VTPPSFGTAEQQRLEQQQRYIDLAITGKRRWLPTSAVVPGTNGRLVPSVAEGFGDHHATTELPMPQRNRP
jgi:hypothetical protein